MASVISIASTAGHAEQRRQLWGVCPAKVIRADRVPLRTVLGKQPQEHRNAKQRPVPLDQRVQAIAEVPTVGQAGLTDFTAATWFGLFGPGSMPPALVEKIYQDVSRIVAEPDMTRRLLEMGGVINNSSPQVFKTVIDSEVKNWSEAVRLSGARVD